jgi:transcriptional regulator with XRE-family HTH domain
VPKIIEFLGYVPFECPEYPIGNLRYFKLVKGLSYEKLGEMMGRDPEQLTDWLSGRRKPNWENMQSIVIFLHENFW